ncbi:hypothetical protein [Anaeromyxobacter oryzisoli]|uniref:hypothetical protein n=1 Tax=Anaeromyxobacter oryzisoli TaxID=2925408 RepID=UPI001F55BE1F|nr:hypothetical protein [Anaeromyxobacter sp. SG63]
MSPLLALVHAVALAANPVPAGPTDAWCGKAPATPVEVDSDLCSFNGMTVRISLASPTGCFDEDDMTLVFEKAGKKAEVRWPGQYPTSWWMLDPVDPKLHKWKIGTLCNRADAVAVDQERVLFFLRKNGRPNADRLVAVLYDALKAAVLDFADVGPEGDLVGRQAQSVWFSESEWGQVGGMLISSSERGLPLPDGDRLVEARDTERDLNPVTRVWVEGAKVRAEPDFEKTFPRFKKFFADAKAFEAAARRNPDPKHLLVREAKTARGRTCVQLYGWDAHDKWASLPWYCETK